jgi:hypothetical protein
MSLAIRGGATIKNRIISGGSTAEKKCPFSVMAYETATQGQYKAYIEDGEINFTSFYQKNGGQAGGPGPAAAEISITPDTELALSVVFMHDDYEYKKIQEIHVISSDFDSSDREAWATRVADYGEGKMQITMYVPLAYIYLYTPPESPPDARPQVLVKQYWCGNLDFRLYYTTVNGAPCFEFFKTWGLTPGKIPMPAPES